MLNKLEKKRFEEILNRQITPTMPPMFRGAVDDLIDKQKIESCNVHLKITEEEIRNEV